MSVVRLSLKDGYLEIDPFPEELKTELRYWKKELAWNPATHKREVKGHYESLWSIVDGKTVAMPGHAHKVLEFFRARGWGIQFDDLRTPFPKPDFDRAMQGLRPYQQEIVAKMLLAQGGILHASTGLGKALPNTARIPTPQGWRLVGEIRPGDQVFGSNGQPCQVLAVHPQPQTQQIYEVEFVDGRVVECCQDHLWFWSTSTSGRYAWKTSTTKGLQELLPQLTARKRAPRVPICQPVQYSRKNLPVHPYVLGALLGNGSLKEHPLIVSSGDTFVPEKLAKLLDAPVYKPSQHNYSYGFRLQKPIFTGKRAQVNVHTADILTGCCAPLVGCGSGDKFIPAEYLCADMAQRRALLQGLMDTDGHVDRKGRMTYSTTSRKLAYGIAELAYSLGLVTRVNKETRTDYRSGECFYLMIRGRPELKRQIVTHPDKLANLEYGLAHGNRQEHNTAIRIVDIRPTERYADMTCFTVDSPDSLFLCQNYIVTHNTFMSARLIDAFSPDDLKARGTPISVFAAPSKDITRKNAEELAELLPHREVGLVMSGVNRFSDDVQVITLDSLHRLDPDEVGLLIVDEMHTAASDTHVEDLMKFVKARKYGVSATPSGRFDGKDVVAEGIFGPVVVQKTYKDGVEAGALVPIEVVWINSPEPSVGMARYLSYKTRDGKIGAGSIGNRGQNTIIANILNNLPADTQCLVITQFIEHMHKIYQCCNDDVVYAHAQTTDKGLEKYPGIKPISNKERKDIYARMASGELKKVISTHIFKQGVNFVHLNIVVNASGGGSDIAAAQIPGRASRKAEGKDKAYMIEFWHDWDLEDGHAGPLLSADKQRRKVYTELGFKQTWIEPDQLKSMDFMQDSRLTPSTNT